MARSGRMRASWRSTRGARARTAASMQSTTSRPARTTAPWTRMVPSRSEHDLVLVLHGRENAQDDLVLCEYAHVHRLAVGILPDHEVVRVQDEVVLRAGCPRPRRGRRRPARGRGRVRAWPRISPHLAHLVRWPGVAVCVRRGFEGEEQVRGPATSPRLPHELAPGVRAARSDSPSSPRRPGRCIVARAGRPRAVRDLHASGGCAHRRISLRPGGIP